MPNTSQELPSAEQVQELTAEQRRTRLAARVALGALAFSIASSILVWTHSARVAATAKVEARAEAVAEANRAREEADAGLCEVLGLIIDSDTPSRSDSFRDALRKAYEAPGCVPPIDQRPKPTPTPTAAG